MGLLRCCTCRTRDVIGHRVAAVGPRLKREFADLVHSAGLPGFGSDVLGFDDARSTDHAWGPGPLLFLSEADGKTYATRISETLSRPLPPTLLSEQIFWLC